MGRLVGFALLPIALASCASAPRTAEAGASRPGFCSRLLSGDYSANPKEEPSSSGGFADLAPVVFGYAMAGVCRIAQG